MSREARQGYLVFARQDFEQALACVEELEPPDGQVPEATVRERALARHGNAIELVLVPLNAAHWVVRPEVEAESGAQ